MGFPGDKPPFYAFEAVQIFQDCGAFPEFVPNSGTSSLETGKSGIWLERGGAGACERVEISCFGASSELEEHKLQKRRIYQVMCDFTGYRSPWGCMTGVRPAKIVNLLLQSGMTPEEAVKQLTEFYLTDPQKAQLALETAQNQERFLLRQQNQPQNIAIYVGIPFCPTRCLYCSFPSNPIQKYRKQVDLYIDLLEQELKTVLPQAAAAGLRIESLYIGGGTPTSLDAAQFQRLMAILTDVIPVAELCEFSLEAGRPDSITEEKLGIAKCAGVTRISINPQTMQDSTLVSIGRRHTAEDIVQAFALARKYGFENINMDIIAGLPGELPEDFSDTLHKIYELRPDALTVHTLSVKRAAELKHDARVTTLRHDVTGQMLALSYETAHRMGMAPFYMYRQKNMLGNHENVSYCRPGCESPYNIHIMEEDQTVLAFGAGGVSKLSAKLPDGERSVERSFNVKGVEHYLARSEEMAARKLKLIAGVSSDR